MEHTRLKVKRLLVLASCLAWCAISPAQFMINPGEEWRTINTDSYEVVIEKGGEVDIRLLDGLPVFDSAFPMVWFEGEEEGEPLDVLGRATAREDVRDRLGEGQGFVWKRGNAEWSIRAYPDKPFFVVQCAYVNDSRAPVTVRALSPWSVGEPRRRGGFLLGEGDIDQVVTLPHEESRWAQHRMPALQRAEGFSYWNLAALDEATGRSLIAGFLTNQASDYTTISFRRGDDAAERGFDRFRAVCVFDPPVVVQPEESLMSDALYIGISESNPVAGLERFGQAYRIANERVSHKAVNGIYEATWDEGLGAGPLGLFTGTPPPALTRIVGGGPDSITPSNTPMPRLEAPFANTAGPIAPRWTQPSRNEPLGIAGAMARLARAWYLQPHWAVPVAWPLDAAQEHLRPALTAAALMGAPLALRDYHGLPPQQQEDVHRAMVDVPRSARPLDIFQAMPPRIWHLPIETPAGQWDLVALFNWEAEDSISIGLDFAALDLEREQYYTVFDVWERSYEGIAQQSLNVALAPKSMKLLMLRKREDRPTVAAHDATLLAGADTVRRIAWDGESQVLSGTLHIEGSSSSLHLSAPEAYVIDHVTLAGEDAVFERERSRVTIPLPTHHGAVEWEVRFKRQGAAR